MAILRATTVRLLEFADSHLPVVLIHRDFQPWRPPTESLVQATQELFADPAGEQFRRGVGDRQDAAIAERKDPAAAVRREDNRRFLRSGGQLEQRMPIGKEHAVIEFIGDRSQFVAGSNEVDDVAVLVEGPGDLDGHAIVVTM